jgi:serine/threonine protein kinase
MSLGPGTRLGPYEVISALGAGGMGEVCRARDTRLGRDVAIKVLPAGLSSDPDRLARFEQEARAAAAGLRSWSRHICISLARDELDEGKEITRYVSTR